MPSPAPPDSCRSTIPIGHSPPQVRSCTPPYGGRLQVGSEKSLADFRVWVSQMLFKDRQDGLAEIEEFVGGLFTVHVSFGAEASDGSLRQLWTLTVWIGPFLPGTSGRIVERSFSGPVHAVPPLFPRLREGT